MNFIKSPLGIVLIIIAAICVWLGSTYVSYANYGNRAEVGLKQKHKNIEQVMSNGLQKIAGKVQVTEMYSNDFTAAYLKAITAREGADGSRAAVKVLREANPHLSETMYRDISLEISATRNEVQSLNSAFLTQKAAYEEATGTVWGGMWLRLAGYPRNDLDFVYKIPTLASVQKSMQTGVEEGFKLR